MRYNQPSFVVEAGRPVQIALENEDLMPHNFVITKPGKLKDVALAGAELGTTPGLDGKLYVPVGAPCNVCESEDIYASITRMNADGLDMEIIAHGIRNTVGFDWHPDTGDLWFTDNGRDWMGDNRPPDELNRLTEVGQHFGFPYCHGRDALDPEYGEGRTCSEFTLPEAELGPHVAALGMRFYTGDMFPERYKNGAFIAFHGSWNRAPEPQEGYYVVFVPFDGENPSGDWEVFADGFAGEEVIESTSDAEYRPCGLAQGPDGSLYVVDSNKGKVWRIIHS